MRETTISDSRSPESASAITKHSIGEAINALLDARKPGASICPSEVARSLTPAEAGEAWRKLMPQVRDVAADLAAAGKLTVTRKGAVVDARSPGGPIRLSRPR